MRIAKYQDTKHPGCSDLTAVYLHAGTLEGVKAIFDVGDLATSVQKCDIKAEKKININCFPNSLNELSGDHLENLLCIYKNDFKTQIISKHNKCKFCI